MYLKMPLLYILVFAYGALLMYFEVLSARVIIPFYGASMKVWASVFCGVLTGLSAGYYLGGLTRLRYLPSLCCMISGLFIFTIPFLSNAYMELFYALGHNMGILLTSMMICFLPSLGFGMLSPSIVNLLSSTPEETGRLAGRVFALSTVGGVIMAILSGFWLIPHIGVANSSLLIGVVMICMSGLFSIIFPHRGMLLCSTFCLLLMMLLGSYYLIGYKKQDLVKYKRTGFYGELIVADVPHKYDDKQFNARVLLNNRIAQSMIDLDTGISVWRYIHYLSALSSPKPPGSNVLMLGLAGGSLAKELIDMGIGVDALDIDPRVYEVARDFFMLPAGCRFFVDDARHFLNTSKSRYDIIIIDLFAAESQPFHVFTLEAFQRMRELLKDDGYILINFHESVKGEKGLGFRSVYKTMLRAGYYVSYVSTSRYEGEERNNILIGTKGSFEWKNATFRQREIYREMGISFPPKFLKMGEKELAEDFLLTDDKPIFEVINEKAFKEWREHAIRNYLITFRLMGIPFF